MTAITVTLKKLLDLTDDAFYELCRSNPDVKFERTATGELTIMSPTGGESERDGQSPLGRKQEEGRGHVKDLLSCRQASDLPGSGYRDLICSQRMGRPLRCRGGSLRRAIRSASPSC